MSSPMSRKFKSPWTFETIQEKVPMGFLFYEALVEGSRTINEPETPSVEELRQLARYFGINGIRANSRLGSDKLLEKLNGNVECKALIAAAQDRFTLNKTDAAVSKERDTSLIQNSRKTVVNNTSPDTQLGVETIVKSVVAHVDLSNMPEGGNPDVNPCTDDSEHQYRMTVVKNSLATYLKVNDRELTSSELAAINDVRAVLKKSSCSGGELAVATYLLMSSKLLNLQSVDVHNERILKRDLGIDEISRESKCIKISDTKFLFSHIEVTLVKKMIDSIFESDSMPPRYEGNSQQTFYKIMGLIAKVGCAATLIDSSPTSNGISLDTFETLFERLIGPIEETAEDTPPNKRTGFKNQQRIAYKAALVNVCGEHCFNNKNKVKLLQHCETGAGHDNGPKFLHRYCLPRIRCGTFDDGTDFDSSKLWVQFYSALKTLKLV